MWKYLGRRVTGSILTFVILAFVIFQIMALMPGDPVDVMVSSIPNVTGEDIIRLKKLYGLDKPGYIRFYNWFSSAISGDLGHSRTYKIPVTEIIGAPIINTFILSIGSLGLALLLAIPFGVMAAVKPHSKFDYFINVVAFAGISIPSFWFGIVLIIIFSVYIPILPAGGTETVESEAMGLFSFLGDRLKYIILPIASLTFFQMGSFVRYVRGAMLETLHDDYIRTAYAKGQTARKVLLVHAFRNALIPLITVAAVRFGYIFSGAIITETVFAYHGLGKLVYNSVISNDFNVAMVGLLLVVGMVLLMNLVADILYAVVDPRVSYE